MAKTMSASELIDSYQLRLWRYLRYLGCSDSQADDLVQETFLAVLRKPFEQRGEAQTSAYLRRVAKNQYLMLLRRQRRELPVGEIELADSVWDELTGGSWGDDYLDALGECTRQLTDRAQQALKMRYREGLSRDEMAERLEMAHDGVKTLLRRTRDSLRACIQRKIK